MPHISRKKLSKKTEDELISKLSLVLTEIENRDEMRTFLGALLTETEELMLAKRFALIILLEEGLRDSQIADILHLTRITVAKMRFFNEARGKGFKVAINKLQKHKQFEEFKKMLVSLARYSVRAAGGRVKLKILD